MRNDDPVMRAMVYLVKAYEKIPVFERHEFIDYLQKLLCEMQHELEPNNEGGQDPFAKQSTDGR